MQQWYFLYKYRMMITIIMDMHYYLYMKIKNRIGVHMFEILKIN